MIDPIFLQAADNGTSWPEAWIAIISVAGGITMITVIAAVLIWQVASTWRARMSVAREEAYKRLAQESSDAQHRATATLEAISRDLAELRERTAEMERLLKEVE